MDIRLVRVSDSLDVENEDYVHSLHFLVDGCVVPVDVPPDVYYKVIHSVLRVPHDPTTQEGHTQQQTAQEEQQQYDIREQIQQQIAVILQQVSVAGEDSTTHTIEYTTRGNEHAEETAIRPVRVSLPPKKKKATDEDGITSI